MPQQNDDIEAIVDQMMGDFDRILDSSSDKEKILGMSFATKATVAKLKKEKDEQQLQNVRLLAAQENMIMQYEEQEQLLNALRTREASLTQKIEAQKVSLSSLFADLTDAKKRVAWLEAKLNNNDLACDLNTLVSEQQKEERQEDLLAVPKAETKNSGFFPFSPSVSKGSSVDQQTIRDLKAENARLKSEFIRLQAEYKQEVYINQKAIGDLMEDNMTASTGSSSGNSSTGSVDFEEDTFCAPASTGVSGGSRRNLSTRSASFRTIKELRNERTEVTPMPFSSPQPRKNVYRPAKCTDAHTPRTPVNQSKRIQSTSPKLPSETEKGRKNLRESVSALLSPGRSLWRENSAASEAAPITPGRTPKKLQGLPIPTVYQDEERKVNLHDLANEDEPLERSLRFPSKFWGQQR